MKILHLSTSDIEGGAARATYRLCRGLHSLNITTKMLVRAKLSADASVIAQRNILTKLSPTVSGLPLIIYSQRDHTMFSPQWFPDTIASQVRQINPNIVHLHWICNGYLRIETLAKFNKPLVWTLHDMWAFTGGCHYNQECQKYQNSCGACPQLNSNSTWDLSRWVWYRKSQAWKNLNLTIVTPSAWLAKCASSSSLLKNLPMKVIPNGIDINKYQPIEKNLARKLLNLPQDRQLILFVAMSTAERRKGFHLLQPALKKLSKSNTYNNFELIILGAKQSEEDLDLGFKSNYLGRLNDDISLALVYSSADVFVAPSTQDNLPNTVMESLACGTPCVAFKIGGMSEMIEDRKNGYLAKPYEVEDLAQGISWVIGNKERQQQLSNYARQKAEQEFSLELQASRYLSLFQEVINN